MDEPKKDYIQCLCCNDLVWSMTTVITRHGHVFQKCYKDGTFGNWLMFATLMEA